MPHHRPDAYDVQRSSEIFQEWLNRFGLYDQVIKQYSPAVPSASRQTGDKELIEDIIHRCHSDLQNRISSCRAAMMKDSNPMTGNLYFAYMKLCHEFEWPFKRWRESKASNLPTDLCVLAIKRYILQTVLEHYERTGIGFFGMWS